ncbi:MULTISPECIES: AMP-binding protein [unclassified Carboxylicivirga]|uniref:AMP-binding protein n=1 Tax=Carboxylicivirga TaxID=1628153 RepID=UPI003D34E04B
MKDPIAIQYQKLTFNDRCYSGRQELLMLSDQLMAQADDESVHIAQFLKDWVSDEASIRLHTSGSTGEPKLIEVGKAAMVASAKRTLDFFDLPPGATALLCMSARYIAGKMMLVRALVGGLNLLSVPVSSHPLKGINRRLDFAAMVPMQVATLVEKDPGALFKLGCLIIGGGAVSNKVRKALQHNDINVWETYGMTETVSHIALRPLKDPSVPFRLLPGIAIEADERGCLVIQPSALNEDRLLTNDLVELVSENEFHLLGRYDNIINTGGIKVVPELIESRLKPLIPYPFIVSWKEDALLGQRLVLVIEADASFPCPSFEQVNLKRHELPREVVYLSELPRTVTGKVQRVKLQQVIARP